MAHKQTKTRNAIVRLHTENEGMRLRLARIAELAASAFQHTNSAVLAEIARIAKN